MLDIRHFINDSSFQIIYRNNELDIINYKSINYIFDNKISISFDSNNLLITGNCLYAKKLLNNEILIAGNIKKVEVL